MTHSTSASLICGPIGKLSTWLASCSAIGKLPAVGQITVFSGPERRRRWSEEERVQILTEAFSPGACVAEVARRHDVSTALVYTWRNKLRRSISEPNFAEAVVDDSAAALTGPPAIIVELGRGRRVSILASAPPALVAAALKAMR